MKNNKEFVKMMEGGFGHFNLYQLWAILNNMNELNINTLKVQQTHDRDFICCVDKLTVEQHYRDLDGKVHYDKTIGLDGAVCVEM